MCLQGSDSVEESRAKLQSSLVPFEQLLLSSNPAEDGDSELIH